MVQQSVFADVFWAHWKPLLQISNAAWMASELWIFARDWRGVRGVSQDRGSLALIVAAFVVSVSAAIWCAANLTFARLPDGDIGAIRFAAGLVLMWLGIGLRQWAVATLGGFFRTTVVVQADHRLVTTGPYRWLRNPSYTGAMITVIGQGLTFGNWVALAVLVGGVMAAFVWRIDVETRALRSHFGARYDDYARRSWALIPWVW